MSEALPLSGIRVLDIGTLIAGVIGASILIAVVRAVR